MSDFTEYKRPLVVLLIFAVLIFVIANYGGDMLKYENFVDAPYTCGSAGDRRSCIDAGGFWKEDGTAPAGCDPACACCMHNPSFPITMKYPAMSCPAASSTTFTLTDAQTAFTGTMLPTDTTLARDDSGRLTADSLKSHIEKLVATSKLQAVPEQSADSAAVYAFIQADEAAIQKLQDEYCYYSARYAYAVQMVVDSASASASAPSASGGSSQGADWLAASRSLNTRLQDIISIMKYLTTQRMNIAPNGSSAELNAELAVRMKTLSEQGADLGAQNADTVLYKKMVQYTKQKAKANGNLVLLYTFMNLIAFGMLFYVYRAT